MCLHPVSFMGSLSNYQIRAFFPCLFISLFVGHPPTNSSFASTALSGCRCRRNEERRCRRRPRSAIFTFRRPRAPQSLSCRRRRCRLSQTASLLLLAANRQTAAPLLPWPPRPRDEPTIAGQNAATMRTDSSSSILMNTLT